MTLSPKKVIQDVEESFIRAFAVILKVVSSTQTIVDDKCCDVGLRIGMGGGENNVATQRGACDNRTHTVGTRGPR